MSTETSGLAKHIGLGQGIALYVSAILGAGVLVMPGQVASMAGPASLVSWAFACAMGAALAVMFAALAMRYPDAGGVATYVRAAFGPTTGGVAGWLFFVAGAVGQTIVPLTGGYYVSAAFDLEHHWDYVIAFAILAVAVAANLAGFKVGAAAQLALAGGVGLALLLTIVVAIPSMDFERLTPFAPNGPLPIGSAVIVLFFAFAGWEAVAHLVGEFRDPDRDVPRAVAATVVVVSVLYLGTAAAVVLTGTYGTAQIDRVAIGILLEGALGNAAGIVAGLVALVISLGTTNAFVAGVSRLGHSLARDGWLPASAGRISRAGQPVGGIGAVALVAATGTTLAWIFDWGTETLVVVPSTLVVAVYLLAAAAGVRLLRGLGRLCAVVTIVMTMTVVPSAAENVTIVIAIVVVALLAHWTWRPRSAGQRRLQVPLSSRTRVGLVARPAVPNAGGIDPAETAQRPEPVVYGESTPHRPGRAP